MTNKGMMWGILALALAIGIFIGYLIERSRATSKMEAAKMDFAKQLEDVKMMASKDKTMEKDSIMKKNEDIMKMVMEDQESKKAVLSDVTGGNATGKAFILRKDRKLLFTASANLTDPTGSTFYEGWIVKKGSNPVQFVDTGKLTKQKDGTYQVVYSSDNTYDGYNFVVITWEQIDDQKPEKHILEGMAQ